MPDNQPEIITAEQSVEAVPSQSQEVAVRQAPRAPLVARSRTGMAIIPQSMDEVWRLAGVIAAANMAPKSYGRDQNAITVGIFHGMEVGFTPMAALQSIAVINGMPSIWGDGALALIEDSGLLEDKKEWVDTDENGGLVAHCEMKRKGRSWTIQQFSWQDAKIAKLDKKDTYQQYGRRMLQRRARAWAMTDGFSDVLRGLHIREAITIQDVEDEDKGVDTAAPVVARPTRESAKLADKSTAENVRKAELAMNKEFKAVVEQDARAEVTEKARGPETEPHDPETGEITAEPTNAELAQGRAALGPDPTTLPAATPAASASTGEHEATERVLRRKLSEYKTVKMFRGPFGDYRPELEQMRAEDPVRFKKLITDIYEKWPELKPEAK